MLILIVVEITVQGVGFLVRTHNRNKNFSLAQKALAAKNISVSLKEHANPAEQKASQVVTIVCLGESTTAVAYPGPLQEELSRRIGSKRFFVIDEGQPGVNSDRLMQKIPLIKSYKPDIVIAMMGGNDGQQLATLYGTITNPIDYWLVKHIKTYNMIRYFGYALLSANTKPENLLPEPFETNTQFSVELSPLAAQVKKRLDFYSGKRNGIRTELERCLDKNRQSLLEHNWASLFSSDDFLWDNILDVSSYDSYLFASEFARILVERNRDDLDSLLSLFRFLEAGMANAPTVARRNANAFLLLLCFERTKDFGRIPPIADFLLESYPGNLYFRSLKASCGSAFDAEYIADWCVYVDALVENPLQNLPFYKNILNFPYNRQELAKLSLQSNGMDFARMVEVLIEKLLGVFPELDFLYMNLCDIYVANGERGKIAVLYNFWLANASGFQKNDQTMVNYWVKAIGLLKGASIFPAYESKMLNKNYIKLAQFCRDNGIQLVCMQYPMLDIEPLEKLLKDFDVIFVSNSEPFRTMVAKNGFSACFADNSGGCFGHATDEGNRLIAKNVVNVLLSELFLEKFFAAPGLRSVREKDNEALERMVEDYGKNG